MIDFGDNYYDRILLDKIDTSNVYYNDFRAFLHYPFAAL